MKPNIPKEDNGPPYLDNSQIAILNGLKEIGEKIASLYYDGIKIFNSEFKSKSYLLAHIAREIEGGIRDIFVSGLRREVQKCSECGSIKQSISHIDEICKVLDVNKEDEFAKEWHKIAVEFHKYAHRHGPWKTPRDENEFNALWKRFEKILHYLVGDYIKLTSLVYKVLKHEVPTEEILGTLGNLLRNEARKRYFFKKLQSIHWLKSLFELGYFRPECAPSPQPAEEKGYFVIPEWDVLPYVERVSQQVNIPGNEKYIDELLCIIQEVTNYHIKHEKALDNYRTWWYFVKILLNLPTEKITEEIINLIPIWLDSKFSTMLPGTEIAIKLLPKFLTGNPDDIKKAEKIIESITAIKTFPLSEERSKILSKEEEAGLVIDSHWLKNL